MKDSDQENETEGDHVCPSNSADLENAQSEEDRSTPTGARPAPEGNEMELSNEELNNQPVQQVSDCKRSN